MNEPESLDGGPHDFTPVATASRSDGWTPDRQRRFIAALGEHGGVAAAARSVGMTPQTANRLRKRPDAGSFAEAWDKAVEEGRLRSYDEAVTRGLNGYLAPVIRHGKVVGHRHRFDNRLLYAACYGEPMGRFGNKERR